MPLIIIDGSDPFDPCRAYVKSLSSSLTTVAIAKTNIGHGRGMHFGIGMAKTRFVLIFDSDIVMLKSPVEEMLKLMEDDTYGVGYNEETGPDGFEYKVHNRVLPSTPVKYLHPYFMLLQVKNYYKFPPFVHHGAPCYMAMNAIKEQGLSEKILIEFPGLGHSAGTGWGWKAAKREFIQHDTAGTRNDRKKKGKKEIEGVWEYYKDNRPKAPGLFIPKPRIDPIKTIKRGLGTIK